GGIAKAYPFAELQKGAVTVRDEVNGRSVIIRFNKRAQSASITDPAGQSIPSVMAYWFAWFAFHPDTLVFVAKKPDLD
ncbi:MAG: hypothetical protein VST67_13470, partial [Nitrospirota bacterium]|nr:hypothetical protein [Nitrospirota bacterium]